jgi:hypothetical protein
MSYVIIGFSRPKGFTPITSLIRWVESTPYNHVFLKFQEPFTRKWMVLEADTFSVRLLSAESLESTNVVVSTSIIGVTEAQLGDLLVKAYSVLARPYSFLGLLGHLVKLVARLPYNPYKDRGQSFICSELVAYLLDLPNPEEQTPRSLYESLMKERE